MSNTSRPQYESLSPADAEMIARISKMRHGAYNIKTGILEAFPTILDDLNRVTLVETQPAPQVEAAPAPEAEPIIPEQLPTDAYEGQNQRLNELSQKIADLYGKAA